jgi:protein TonB
VPPAFLASLLLHGAVLGGALLWAGHRALAVLGAEHPATVEVAEALPAAPDPVLAPVPDSVEIEPLPEIAEVPPLPDVDVVEQEPETLFDEATADEAEQTPKLVEEVPLTAFRPRPRPQRPVALPTPPRSTPVSAPSRIRARPRPVPTRRVAAAPTRAPLRVLYAPDPRGYYPSEAQRMGLEGAVLLVILIDEAGLVRDARVERGSGQPLLDRAAVSLGMAYRFSAGASWRRTRLPVTFRIPD